MAGRRRIDDDQIGGAVTFELLHLAEHEQMLEAGCRRSDHRQRGRGRRSAQHAADPLEFEVVAERLVGGNRAAPDLAGALDPPQDPVGVVEFTSPEQRTHPGSAVDGDEQHVGALAGGSECVCRRDRRRSDAALARHDSDPSAREPVVNHHPSRYRRVPSGDRQNTAVSWPMPNVTWRSGDRRCRRGSTRRARRRHTPRPLPRRGRRCPDRFRRPSHRVHGRGPRSGHCRWRWERTGTHRAHRHWRRAVRRRAGGPPPRWRSRGHAVSWRWTPIGTSTAARARSTRRAVSVGTATPIVSASPIDEAPAAAARRASSTTRSGSTRCSNGHPIAVASVISTIAPPSIASTANTSNAASASSVPAPAL